MLGEKAKAGRLPASAIANTAKRARKKFAMAVSYNQIAGQSAERLAALSDGVFAVAMTLLLLDLHVPARDAIHSERDLLHAIAALLPQLAIYLMSFLTLWEFSGWDSKHS